MTAVAAQPVPFQSNSRLGWSSDGSGFGPANSEDVSRMFAPAPRKTVQRQTSSSSIASTASSTSTISGSTAQTNGTSAPASEAGNWATRKKPSRGLWPPGKAEPATGLTTARPQAVSSAASGTTASSAISALHAPMLPSQQVANGTAQANGAARGQTSSEPPAILHLLPMNGTFERKTITVPYYPDVLRIGRQTNQKTIPTPLNGYFDSKVLSRQHAEVWADRQGRVFIRDVKSSNGTFVNGMRLSQENKESEPRELREQDVLELGIDIVSEDQKTVVHHKVAAKVEHAGVYGPGSEALNFGDLDPNAGAGQLAGTHTMKRNNNQSSGNPRNPANVQAMNQAAVNMNAVNQPQVRNWLNPITPEHIVRRLNAEMKLAMQQSQDIARARQAIEAMLSGKSEPVLKETKTGSERSRPSPIKPKGDLRAHFMEPPAPPPQAPLPEKPDVARALADPIIQPLLRRSDTARPSSVSSSPTRTDHSGDILRLCEELKLAKGELSNQSERMKTLELELALEKTAREGAEERAQRLERFGPRLDNGAEVSESEQPGEGSEKAQNKTSEMQLQLDRLRSSMDEMKTQMEAYRQRALDAEDERDSARQSLAEMVEQKRKENAECEHTQSPSRLSKSARTSIPKVDGHASEQNGHVVGNSTSLPTRESLLERAGIEEGQPITPEQAKLITSFLSKEVLGSQSSDEVEKALAHYGIPYGSAAAVVLFGFLIMTWVNGWPKVER